jgi:SAM-dependent methyltransferase
LTEESDGRNKQLLADSFGAIAHDYERARPGYPGEAVEWITGGHRRVILDVAAGTGKLTAQLSNLGNFVVALEPSLEMLDRLRAAHPHIPAAAGRAEALPFAEGSFDIVTVAQAFHWFDGPVAIAEFARVLRPGGHLVILWNFRDDSVDWVAELSKLIGSEGAEKEKEGSYDPLPSSSPFGPSTNRTFRLEQPLDPALLVGLVRSRSYVATLPSDEQEALLRKVARLCDEHPALAGRSEFVMPYRTEVFVAEKTPQASF